MTTAKLRILETTDLHMELFGFDYFSDYQRDDRGLDKLGHLIEKERKKEGLTLVFDNGDFLQGTPLADRIMQDQNPNNHVLTEMMNTIDYDAVTIGNHDLDYGMDALLAFSEALEAPIVCSNLTVNDKPVFNPWLVLKRDVLCADQRMRQLNIGLVGALPPQSIDWNRHTLPTELKCGDIIDSIAEVLTSLVEAGADIIIALSHTGMGETQHRTYMENALIPLAQLDGLDVLLFGHSHQEFPKPTQPDTNLISNSAGTIAGKPAVSTGAYARHLGKIELDLSFSNERWAISRHHSSLLRIEPNNEHGPIPASIKKAHQNLRQSLRETASTLATPVNSFFTAAGYPQTNQILSQAIRSYVGARFADENLLVAASTFQVGGRKGASNYHHFEAGAVSKAGIISLAPFNNPICAINLTGWQIRSWLAHASNFFVTIGAEQGEQNILNHSFPSFNFDLFDAIQFEIDLSEPVTKPSKRIPKIWFEGTPLDDEQAFTVLTSTYRAAGGGGFPKIPQNEVTWQSKIGISDILLNSLDENTSIAVTNEPQFSFAPIKNVRAVFETSTKAKPHIPSANIEWLSDKGDGFSRYSLLLG